MLRFCIASQPVVNNSDVKRKYGKRYAYCHLCLVDTVHRAKERTSLHLAPAAIRAVDRAPAAGDRSGVHRVPAQAADQLCRGAPPAQGRGLPDAGRARRRTQLHAAAERPRMPEPARQRHAQRRLPLPAPRHAPQRLAGQVPVQDRRPVLPEPAQAPRQGGTGAAAAGAESHLQRGLVRNRQQVPGAGRRRRRFAPGAAPGAQPHLPGRRPRLTEGVAGVDIDEAPARVVGADVIAILELRGDRHKRLRLAVEQVAHAERQRGVLQAAPRQVGVVRRLRPHEHPLVEQVVRRLVARAVVLDQRGRQRALRPCRAERVLPAQHHAAGVGADHRRALAIDQRAHLVRHHAARAGLVELVHVGAVQRHLQPAGTEGLAAGDEHVRALHRGVAGVGQHRLHQVPQAAGDRRLVVLRAAMRGRRAAAAADLQPLEALRQDEIDHAGHRVAAIHAGRAILQHLDALDGRQRYHIDVDRRPAAAGKRRQPPPVDQHQRALRSQPAQRNRRQPESAARRPRRVGRRPRRRQRRDRRQQTLRAGRTDALDILLADHLHRQRGFRIGALDRRPGHLDAMHLVAAILLRHGRRQHHRQPAGKHHAQRLRQYGFLHCLLPL
ncbi:conserved hypothetical protein, partial [Ricinus communis]